ncbi:major facilitator superfamily domain-containing 8-like [Paramuricea clavata]|uniref:Major facilitator superfamily domain-containing 8-like n=1 Tax=Paramuricea clavata TaxID=317549 RepID=A0A7D9IB66_PARCT|nr:major facilitator superfamily domain-containing 8-like [Paramuricea clavata]
MKTFSFEQKLRMTFFAFSLRMVLMGVEFAVIFPSVWLYLKIFNADYWYLGLVLSAYNMIGIISTLLVGHLADSTGQIRFMGFLWNIAEIAGNLIYALHFHVAFPLIGRMISGFGEGYISAMWGEIARITTEEQRTRYFAILKGANLLGTAIGPALNLFLKEFDFYIGHWHIDFRTSSGFFMGIVWIAVTIVMLGMVFDLSAELQKAGKLKQFQKTGRLDIDEKGGSIEDSGVKNPGGEDEEVKNEDGGIKGSEDGGVKEPERSEEGQAVGEETKDWEDTTDDGTSEKQGGNVEAKQSQGGDERTETEEQKGETEMTKDLTEHKDTKSETEVVVKSVEEDEPEEPRGTFKTAMLDMFTKFEVNVLVYLFFFMYVTHTCLQGITPLFAELMLKWDETKISIVYTAWGIEIMFVLIIIWIVAPYVADRVILIWAVFGGTLASVSLVVLTYSEPESMLCYYSFLTTIFLGGIGIAITVVVGRSLISKHTSPENQCLVHAILTSLNRMAGLTGPIFGSSLYTNKIVMGYLIGGMQFIGLVLLLIVYKKL